MGTLVYYCAGADLNNLPAQNINALLLNALDHGANDKKIENAQKMCRKANPSHKILDSSGFQILMGEEKGKSMTFNPGLPMKNTAKFLNLSPQHVMQTATIHQPDIVVGLDFPIRKLKSVVQQQLEFFKKLPLNVQWAYESYAWRNALIPSTQYFQPLQCYTLEHLDIFLNEICEMGFDGVSLPVRNLKPADLALFLVSFYKRGIRRVHLLGTSSFLVIALCAYAARNMFEWISLDSTTWRFAADKENFINPLDLLRTDLRPSIHVPTYALNLCLCPFCCGRSFHSIQTLVPRRDKVRLLRQHNWWAIENVVSDLYANGTTIPKLEKELKARCRNHRRMDDLIRILSVIDLFKDGDISTLQMLLAPNLTGRKRSRSPRRSTDAELDPRKPARLARRRTVNVCSP